MWLNLNFTISCFWVNVLFPLFRVCVAGFGGRSRRSWIFGFRRFGSTTTDTCAKPRGKTTSPATIHGVTDAGEARVPHASERAYMIGTSSWHARSIMQRHSSSHSRNKQNVLVWQSIIGCTEKRLREHRYSGKTRCSTYAYGDGTTFFAVYVWFDLDYL